MPKPASETFQKVTLRLPESLHAQYEQRASQQGRTVEDELLYRLRACHSHTDAQPVYLTDAQRRELSTITGTLIASADDLMSWARAITSLKVEHVDVPLDEQLVKRLESRRFGKTWPELMRSMVREGLETAVGLR